MTFKEAYESGKRFRLSGTFSRWQTQQEIRDEVLTVSEFLFTTGKSNPNPRYLSAGLISTLREMIQLHIFLKNMQIFMHKRIE